MAAPPRDQRHKPHFHKDTPWKEHVRVAATANVNTSTGLNAGDVVDGVTLAAGDRVLLPVQSDLADALIWVAGATPAIAYDCELGSDVIAGFVFVTEGTANAGTLWYVTNDTVPDVGTDDISWAQFDPGGDDFELNIEGGQSVISAHGNTGTTETFDPTAGNIHTATLNADCTFTLAAPVGSGAATLELYITASGTRTWTWPGSVVWPGGVTPDPPADTLLKRLILETLDGGTTWYGVEVGGGSSFATPAITLGDTPADGVATTVIRSDATIVAFDDGADPTTQDFDDAADPGTDDFAARRDHGHGMPSAPASSSGGGHLLIASEHSSPLVFEDMVQNSEGSDFMYASE